MSLAKLTKASNKFHTTKKAHDAAHDAAVAEVVAALKAGHRPADVTAASPFSERKVRTIAAAHDIPAATPGPAPRTTA